MQGFDGRALAERTGQSIQALRWRKLIFASVASDKDSVCVGFIDGKTNHYVRFDDVDRFEHGKMQAEGTLPMDVPNAGVHYVEVIAQNQVPVNRNIGRKTIGCILKP